MAGGFAREGIPEGMSHTLDQALDAMNLLNSWVRTEGTALTSRPRAAIYWLKSRYAIRDAVMAGMLTRMRAIQVVAKCHKCREGTYYDWDGYPRGKCYDCQGTAKVTLKFVETRIADRFTWHSPLKYNSWIGWPMDDLQCEESQDWTVKQPGRALDVEEAARCLNIVETYWPQWKKDQPYSLSREEYDNYRYYHFRYSLDIGLVEGPFKGGCILCGKPKTVNSHSSIKPGVAFHVPTCDECHKLPNFLERVAAVPLPEYGPELSLWVKRHQEAYDFFWAKGDSDNRNI